MLYKNIWIDTSNYWKDPVNKVMICFPEIEGYCKTVKEAKKAITEYIESKTPNSIKFIMSLGKKRTRYYPPEDKYPF